MDRKIAIQKIAAKFSIPEQEIIDLLDGKIAPKKIEAKISTEKPKKVVLIKPAEKKHRSHIKRKFFFLEEDHVLLINKMNDVLLELKRLGDEIGDSCSESETFHDNFDYEEGGRQQRMWTEHLMRLRDIKENSEIIKVNNSNDCVGIGKKVTLKSDSGEVITKKIGSYMTFSDDNLSYRSPLAKILIGKKIGEEVKFLNKHELKIFVIEAIN